TIGDEAAHRAATIAVKLWESGVRGRLHLEHTEIMRPQTIQLLKGQNVVCHLQPCHWLSDKVWLKEKVGSLFSYSFPWRALQESSIEFHFGSDSPIEEPGFKTTFAALKDSAEHGIPALDGPVMNYLSHSDPTWVS